MNKLCIKIYHNNSLELTSNQI